MIRRGSLSLTSTNLIIQYIIKRSARELISWKLLNNYKIAQHNRHGCLLCPLTQKNKAPYDRRENAEKLILIWYSHHLGPIQLKSWPIEPEITIWLSWAGSFHPTKKTVLKNQVKESFLFPLSSIPWATKHEETDEQPSWILELLRSPLQKGHQSKRKFQKERLQLLG